MPPLPPLLRAASEALLALPGAGVYPAELQATGAGGEEGVLEAGEEGEVREEGGEGVVDPEGAGGVVVVGVPPSHSPPPRLAGRSCVYLLQARQL